MGTRNDDDRGTGRIAAILLMVGLLALVPLGGVVFADAGSSGASAAQETTQATTEAGTQATETTEATEATEEETGAATETTEAGTEMTTQATTQGEQGPAMVRVVHASPDVGAVDVQIDNETVATEVPFATVGEYMEVEPGQHSITLTASQNSDLTAETTFFVRAGGSYSLVASGEISEGQDVPFELATVEDRRAGAADGAAVRLGHFSPDGQQVDVTVAGSNRVLFDGISSATTSSYATLPAGDYTLQVRNATAGNDGQVVQEVDVTVEQGNVYTAWAVGYASFQDEPVVEPVQVVVSNDTLAGAQPAPVTTQAATQETQATTQATTQAAGTQMTTQATTQATMQATTQATTANGTTANETAA